VGTTSAAGIESGSSAPSGRRRFRQVDTMRALAALSIVLYHVGTSQLRPGDTLVNYLDEHQSGPPVTAVVLFFLISGFVLYRPFVSARFENRRPPALLPYAVHRITRIVPAYWLALTVVSIWFGYSYILHPSGFIRYFFFLQIYANLHTFLGGLAVAWSLCVEITFYAALPALALSTRRFSRRRSLISAELVLAGSMLITSILWQWFVAHSRWAAVHGWRFSLLSMLPSMLGLFAAGMLLAVFSVEYDSRVTPRRVATLINEHPGLLWLAAAALLYGEGRVPISLGLARWWILTVLLKLLACGLLLAPLMIGPQDKGLLRRVLGTAPLVWLGSVSYGIYLWHFPILERIRPLIPHAGLIVITLVVAVLATGAAAVSFYLLERPCQRLGRRFIDRRERRAAARPAAPGPQTPV
jgi:peptidoglycan/LPS O-acetylase OafA/YrhL